MSAFSKIHLSPPAPWPGARACHLIRLSQEVNCTHYVMLTPSADQCISGRYITISKSPPLGGSIREIPAQILPTTAVTIFAKPIAPTCTLKEPATTETGTLFWTIFRWTPDTFFLGWRFEFQDRLSHRAPSSRQRFCRLYWRQAHSSHVDLL